MAESFTAVPGELVPGTAWPGDPGTVAAAPVPAPGAAQRPVIVAYRN